MLRLSHSYMALLFSSHNAQLKKSKGWLLNNTQVLVPYTLLTMHQTLIHKSPFNRSEWEQEAFMQVWSICTVACAHKWDYSLNEWCRLPKANKSVITCLGPWWQSLCWWQLSGNEEERITFTFHRALAWSSLHRGHLGRNATILPVIKLLIQPQCVDFDLIFQSISGLISLHAAFAP